MAAQGSKDGGFKVGVFCLISIPKTTDGLVLRSQSCNSLVLQVILIQPANFVSLQEEASAETPRPSSQSRYGGLRVCLRADIAPNSCGVNARARGADC